MNLDYDFYRLPLRFDAERLAAEVADFAEDEWIPHPSGFAGNSALPLISSEGSLENDGLVGRQYPTRYLDRCPYLKQVLATFDSVLGRTRLMRLAPNSDAKAHMDASYYWHQRVRIHVPIQTHPDILFHSGASAVHMAAGDCWIFNTWNMHSVKNETACTRIHLVADTVGSASLWDMIGDAQTIPSAAESEASGKSARFVGFREGARPQLETEMVNFPVVMSPWEQESLLAPLLQDLRVRYPAERRELGHVETALQRFRRQWHNSWALYGQEESGWPAYRNHLESLRAALNQVEGKLYLGNGMEATGMIDQAVIAPALTTAAAGTPRRASVGLAREPTSPAAQALKQTPAPRPEPADRSVFDRPVIIVSAPRSGSSFLFETLSRSPAVFSLGGESHGVFESIPKLQPSNRLYESNRLTARDADPQTCSILRRAFLQKVRDTRGAPPVRGKRFRLLEKTPKNALRIPFLNALFPDALFVFLYREPAGNISSIVEAWNSGRFVTYPELPGWSGPDWSLLLTPGWRDLDGSDLFAIAREQWRVTNTQILDDLEAIEPDRWLATSYEDLLADTPAVINRICRFAGFPWDQSLAEDLPLSRHTVSAPAKDKWRRHEKDIAPLLPGAEAVDSRVQLALEASRSRRYSERLAIDPSKDPARSPLRSSHTSNLSQMLEAGNFSFMVSTYQAGKVVIVRSVNGKLNTHFSGFSKPMGLSVLGPKLAVGTRNAVEFYVDVQSPAPAEGSGQGTAASGKFIKRLEQITGNIDIHEMAWSSTDLWLINTRFSSLCTLDLNNNFVPRWHPWFVSSLAPEDRCHLNGLCLVDDQPRYVTALGESDKPGGWREQRAHGGVIMDVQANRFVAKGLSMPHSPRWYRDQLWVLESGKGSLARVNVETGEIETVAELPGFTRGLAFVGDYALVGLSQVRETAVFGSIPITESANERNCGVWVVHIGTGKIVGWLQFKGDVSEVFAVEALVGIAQPDIIQSHESTLDSTFVTPAGVVAGS